MSGQSVFLICVMCSLLGVSTVQGAAKDLIQVYQLTDYDKSEIVRLHNEYRRQAGSSDMKLMSWDDKVAAVAEEYVKQCSFAHSASSIRKTDDFSYLGENLYKSWTSSSVLSATGVNSSSVSWHNEISDYTYADGSCTPGKACGHYTQMVWADTYTVGCGASFCQDSDPRFHHSLIVSCNYGPGGNYVGQKPFKKGTACSQCTNGFITCVDGLCSDGRTSTAVTTTTPKTTTPKTTTPKTTTPKTTTTTRASVTSSSSVGMTSLPATKTTTSGGRNLHASFYITLIILVLACIFA